MLRVVVRPAGRELRANQVLGVAGRVGVADHGDGGVALSGTHRRRLLVVTYWMT